ncbi:hypothetical protein [Herbaspirillum huttiense]|uniref:hypothetical protein n=1 Tax=Herbaspirillum huttiense TaxID=863372 RepID=UPI0039AF2F2D
MKRNWSLKHFPERTALGRALRPASWQAVSSRWHRHGQAGLTLVACALLSALGRALDLGHPAGLVTACAVVHCYCQVYLYLARRRCRRLFMRKGNDHAQGTDVTAIQ